MTANVAWHRAAVTRDRRERLNKHKSVTYGLPACQALANQHWHML